MSRKEGDRTDAEALAIRRIQRGVRVRLIRKALEMGGEAFAQELERLSASLGVPVNYDAAKLSKIERGGRDLTAEEATIIASIDPEDRGAGWLIFGDVARKMGQRGWKQVAG